MLSKKETKLENSIEQKYNNNLLGTLTVEESKYIFERGQGFFCEDIQECAADVLIKRVEQLETKEEKLIEKLEERMESVEKCYQDLIKPYYDEKLNIINVSFMSRKEKEEFINKKNCLLVQKHCYKEILEILKGENIE